MFDYKVALRRIAASQQKWDRQTICASENDHHAPLTLKPRFREIGVRVRLCRFEYPRLARDGDVSGR